MRVIIRRVLTSFIISAFIVICLRQLILQTQTHIPIKTGPSLPVIGKPELPGGGVTNNGLNRSGIIPQVQPIPVGNTVLSQISLKTSSSAQNRVNFANQSQKEQETGKPDSETIPGPDYRKGESREDVACQIPRLDPLDPDVLPFISHPRTFNCTIVQENFVSLTDDGHLRLNSTLVRAYNQSGNFHCRFRKIQNEANNGYSAFDKVNFDSSVMTFPDDVDSVITQCFQGDKEIYYDAFCYPRKIKHAILPNSLEHLSLLVLFFDGVALNMFQRHLPSTFEYMTKVMKFHFLKGHVKVADNSFPNLIPFFTGLRAGDQGKDMKGEVQRLWSQKYDNFPLIWKKYAKNGYATSYFEDWPHVGVFQMETGGFEAADPADHYYFGYSKLTEKGPLVDKSTKFCFGNDGAYSKALDAWRHIIRRYRGKRLWSIHLFTMMTHGFVSDLERADLRFMEFLRDIHENGYLVNTSMIVFSDHGARYPPFRHKIVGRLEDKLPVLAYYFPPEFRTKYPHLMANLANNQWRLTTHFDTHQTMIDILTSNFSVKTAQFKKGTRGMSQLRPIPKSRTCKDASIPEHYCACSTISPIALSEPLVPTLAKTVLTHLNQLLQKYNVSHLCASLSLKRVMSVDREMPNRKVQDSSASAWVRHIVTLEASPSDGRFEATVLFNSNTSEMVVNNVVDRINEYGNQSSCIHDHLMKLYCYCQVKA